MKFSKINRMVIFSFVVMLIIPIAFINWDVDAVSERDNRTLAQNPVRAAVEGERLADAIDDYLDDRIGLREKLITLNSWLTYYVFQDTPSDRVILGKDGWLFYNGEQVPDGAGIAQYLGKQWYTEEQLEAIANSLTVTQEYLENRGCEFVLFIAPNKERVYTEYMPEKYQTMRISEECGTEQLINYLKEYTSIRVVWPYEEIKSYMTENPDRLVYYKLDTHWNQLGGYIGARALLRELGIDIPAAEELSFLEDEKTSGDLYNMMSMDNLKMTDIDYVLDGYPAPETEFQDSGYKSEWEYWNQGKDSRRLFVSRDSFGTAMSDILGAQFDYADLCHREGFSQELFEESEADIFVYEIVEREVGGLAGFVLQETE